MKLLMGTTLIVLFVMLTAAGNYGLAQVAGGKNEVVSTTLHHRWRVVANNGDIIPGDIDARTFNSFNPPSVNVTNLVVFRGRSRGGTMGQPAHGVYLRDMLTASHPITVVFDRNTEVPPPNNVDPPSTFIEPPAFPRIDMWGNTLASRAVHAPVWQFEDTRAGTTGIYAMMDDNLITGASNLGEVPLFDFFAVPEHSGTKFDVFPGAPAVTGNTIVFKGNYTIESDEEIVSHTGVYYRDLLNEPTGGDFAAVPIATNEVTEIPGTGGILFGSTAPPSAAEAVGPNAQQVAVFAGFDNEDDPSAGGIYLAVIGEAYPPLQPLIEIGTQVPGEDPGEVFNLLGEGVSFDGRFVAFWGAWGSEVKNITLFCPEDGNPELIAYCNKLYPDGFDTAVPVNQGIFVHDILTGQTIAVAKTPNHYDDFLFWNFSGRVPGTGEGDDDGEYARWRSSAFVAVSGLVDGTHEDGAYHTVFKARTGDIEASHPNIYIDPIDGIYLKRGPYSKAFFKIVETGMAGTIFDPEAIESGSPLPVTEMAIERDGFRGSSLAITVTMGNEEAGWAGVYLTRIPK